MSDTRKRVLLLVATIVLGLGFLEVAARVRMKLKYGRATSEFYTSTRDPRTGLKVPDPNQDVGPISINSLGFRGPEIDESKPDATIRIAFLGGSTTFCTEASADEATWPAVLCARLAERFPSVAFEYVNAALPAMRADDSRRLRFEIRRRP